MNVKDVGNQIVTLMIRESTEELVKYLKDTFGVKASFERMSDSEFKTESMVLCAVHLTGFSDKIHAIMAIRSTMGLGLKDAKDFVERSELGPLVKDNLFSNEATDLKDQLEKSGCRCEIRC